MTEPRIDKPNDDNGLYTITKL